MSFPVLGRPPLIGIPVDSVDTHLTPDSFWYSEYPWYALGRRYADAVAQAGGVPVLLCYNTSSLETYANVLDGLLLAGMSFDVDPALYGESALHKTTVMRPERTQFEWAIAKLMIDQDKPVLGLTAGMQLVNVILGGTLCQHILEEIPDAENHTQDSPLLSFQHAVTVVPETGLWRAVHIFDANYAQSLEYPDRSLHVETNSYHHQCVKKLGRGVHAVAHTKDGVVEAIEATEFKFCWGIQWNAEFLLTPMDRAIFHAFVEVARNGRRETKQ